MNRNTKKLKLSFNSPQTNEKTPETDFKFRILKETPVVNLRHPDFKLKIRCAGKEDEESAMEDFKTLLTQKWKQFDRDRQTNRSTKVTIHSKETRSFLLLKF